MGGRIADGHGDDGFSSLFELLAPKESLSPGRPGR